MDKGADINMDKSAEIPALLEAGDVAYIKEDLQLAAEKFSLATEYSVGVYGDFAPECFEAYFKYGKTLAAIAQDEEDDPQVQLKSVQQYLQKMTEGTAPANMDDSRIGDPDELPEEERNKIVAEVDQALEENTQKLDDFAKNAKQTSEEDKAEVEAKPEGEEVPDLKEKTPEAAAEEIKDDDDGEPDAEQENADMEEDGEEEEEDLPTIVLAYENLEVARKIAEKNEGAKEWDLKRAEVLAILGELYLKEDKFTEAIADLQTSLELNQKHLDAKDRIIASSYFELALAHNLNDDYLRASELAAKAMEILSFCVEQAKAGKEDAKKVAELEECLKSVTAAHEDYTNSHKDAQMKKALEANEAAKTNVSPEKNENQEPASDITANIRKGGKRPAEDNKDIDDAAAKKSKVDEASAEQSEVPSEPVA